MTDSNKRSGGSALSRWSRLKREAARDKARSAVSPPKSAAAPATVVPTTIAPATAPPATAAPPTAAASAAAIERPDAAGAVDLPPVESLTIDSDFSPFLQPKVDAALKRQALKQLFRDPHFNVMDGLDIYIGDYSQPDPISPEIVRQMVQGRYIFDPPPTRINAQGFVEDVPADELVALEGEPHPPALEAPPELHAEPAAVAPSLPAPQESAPPDPTAAGSERGAETSSTETPSSEASDRMRPKTR